MTITTRSEAKIENDQVKPHSKLLLLAALLLPGGALLLIIPLVKLVRRHVVQACARCSSQTATGG